MPLTPQQRHDLATRAHHCSLALGLEIAEIYANPGALDTKRLVELFNELCEVDRALCAEVDWPSGRRGTG